MRFFMRKINFQDQYLVLKKEGKKFDLIYFLNKFLLIYFKDFDILRIEFY